MENLEDKSNSELGGLIKQLEADHEALKINLLRGYDKLEEIEKSYIKIKKTLNKRIR